MTVYLADTSRIGRKKRCVYSMNATRTPKVSVAGEDPAPPHQIRPRDRDRADDLDPRVEERVVDHPAEHGLPVGLVQLGELAALRRLPPEELDDRHPYEALLEVRVDPRDAVPDLPVGVARPGPEEARRRRRGRGTTAKVDQGQPPVEPQHDDHHAADREDVAEDRHDAEVNSSPIASTSLRMRVIRRPTGVRSKNAGGQALDVGEERLRGGRGPPAGPSTPGGSSGTRPHQALPAASAEEAATPVSPDQSPGTMWSSMAIFTR